MDQITWDAIITYLPGIWAYIFLKKRFFQVPVLSINYFFLTREKYYLIIYKIYFYKLLTLKCITKYTFIAHINQF